MTTKTQTYRVRTYAGTVHSMTEGRSYRLYGATYRNSQSGTSQAGKADCGALVSNAAVLTDEAVTCEKCKR